MSEHRSGTLALVALAALVVLAGCSGAAGGGAQASGDAATASVAPETGGSGDAEYEADTEDTGQSSDTLDVQNRQVIRTGTVALTVENFSETKRELTGVVESRDGYVSDSTQERRGVNDDTYIVGTVTYRVPAERFEETMERIEAAGTVERSSTQSRDVTDQLVDIEARLGNLRAERERLRTLYEQANDTQDVLAVQRELSETQERIERLEARQQSLQRQVAYSTITVEIREERPDPGPVEQWYDVPLVQAFLESVSGVGTTLRAIAVVAAYAAPYAIAFAGPPVLLVFGYLAYRRGLLAWSRPG
jgi:hypothetical protein